ncbi:MAG: alpha/beta hydrolase [Oscillospiraceae bacterium]|nr:alpha/beta hydrolase [Oscillospiraceae bacterium]
MNDCYFTTSDGVRLHYVTGGEGAPLILLTGYTGSTEDFTGNYAALAAQFQVICMDYRGLGRSETPQSGWHIERLAKDLEELRVRLALETFYLAAHSMGNTVAWCYMELFGQQRIRGYVLYEESPCLLVDPSWSEAEQNSFLGKFRMPDPWSFPALPPDSRAVDARRAEFLSRLVREHLSRDWRDVVEAIRVPTIILMGEGSHFGAKELWDYLQNVIPGARLEVVPTDQGGTHMIHRENPVAFNELHHHQHCGDLDHGDGRRHSPGRKGRRASPQNGILKSKREKSA